MSHPIKMNILFILLIIFSLNLHVWADEPYIPEQTSQDASIRDFTNLEQSDEKNLETGPYPFHRFVTIGAIRTYQLLISKSKGSPCPMHPHCSLYSSLTFTRYNPIRAFLMTADRLHRCGHDLGNYDRVVIDDAIKFLDPPFPSFMSSGADLKREQERKTLYLASSQILETTDSSTIFESDDNPGEDARLFHFSESLQTAGDYQRAITEYLRLLSYFPNSPYYLAASKAVFFCYYQLEEYLAAADWGKSLLAQGLLSSQEEAEIKFSLGACYFKLGNFQLARTYLSEVPSGSDDKTLKEKSLLLEGLSYVKQFHWEEAEAAFEQIEVDSQFVTNAQRCQELSQKGQKLRMKKPVIAGFLGIIPGLGYLYDGYPHTALSSFIVNSLFIWGTTEAFRKDNESLGAMLGVLSFGWYAGNIYGSVISAQRKNMKLKDDLVLKFDIGFAF